MTSPILTIDGLTVQLPIEGRMQTVLHDVALTIDEGEAVGLVGESGSGKSMTARAINRLLPPGATTDGRVCFEGVDVAKMGERGLRGLRQRVAMVFQDPRVHVNPVRRIGDFMTEVLVRQLKFSKSDAEQRAIDGLADVGIPDGALRLTQYPHELSGGLLQRVMIATALLIEPALLLADEPTTALDVTTQAEVMAILDELRRERGLSMLFITHDLDLAAAVCDRTVVMYAGQVMESQPSGQLQTSPLHPYTSALVSARPQISAAAERLPAIPGRPLSAFEAPPGCAFAPRCPIVVDDCRATRPELVQISASFVRCIRPGDFDG